MGAWTWLFTQFPVADIELSGPPIHPKAANVLVRTFRESPERPNYYDVRVAPHNVAPFRHEPWIRQFSREELEDPGEVLAQFRQEIWNSVLAVWSPDKG